MSFADDMGYDAYDMEDIPGTHEWCENQFRRIPVLSEDKKKVSQMQYCIHCGSTNVKISRAGRRYCGEICWKKQSTKVSI